MDLRQIKNIIKEFEDSSIDKLEISENDFSIKLEKKSSNEQHTVSPSFTEAVVAAPRAVAAPETVPEEEPELTVPVKAPLVGTFYQSPSPDASRFVKLNQSVIEGDTLFIVEAMKVMNEIKAETSGSIAEVFVENGESIEYGQPLFRLS